MDWYLSSIWNQGTIPDSGTIWMGGNFSHEFSSINPDILLFDGVCFPRPNVNLPIEFTMHTWSPANTVSKTMSLVVANSDVIIVLHIPPGFPVNASQYESHSLSNSATPRASRLGHL